MLSRGHRGSIFSMSCLWRQVAGTYRVAACMCRRSMKCNAAVEALPGLLVPSWQHNTASCAHRDRCAVLTIVQAAHQSAMRYLMCRRMLSVARSALSLFRLSACPGV
jgi:hypothetical protein